jgi:hypothetical protein
LPQDKDFLFAEGRQQIFFFCPKRWRAKKRFFSEDSKAKKKI